MDRWTILPPEAKRIELCLDEAIQNAIVWGNGKDPAKKVRFRLWSEDGRGICILLYYLSEVAYYDSGRTLVLKA